MRIIKSFLNLLAKICGSKKKIVNQSYYADNSIYWSKRNIQCIAESAQRMTDIINESLQIANSTKNNETKASRVILARHKLNELIDYCNKYPLIKIDKLHEIDANIREFEAEIRKDNKLLIRLQDDETYYQNQDIFKGLIYHATLQIQTPLSVLIHHGETFSGPPSKAPCYGADGVWSPVTKTFRELGIPIDEIPERMEASEVGPVRASEYIPFLIDFRKIVEGQEFAAIGFFACARSS